MAKRITVKQHEESSESEAETESTKFFPRRLSTNVKSSVFTTATKEGYLLKQTWTFQRWKRRFFKLKGHKLFYAKAPESEFFDEIDLSNLCFADCSTKNINNSFQIITPTRSLVLGAETRKEMEDWCQALKTAATKEFFDPIPSDQHDFLSGHHHWYATSHARPTYCNVCKEALSGVTSHGLSCEVCKFKVHKRCAAKAISNCKWTTLASVGKDIIEDPDCNLIMPHQWQEGNLPVSAKCIHCEKTCGSVLRLQDWRCLWCKITVHTACRPNVDVRCPLGTSKVSVVPPTCLHSIGVDDAWDLVKPTGACFSPLLVFVNSKSGDNQGVKFLRRFKQLLNPAQVFDLISTGPELGLRLFRHFDPFRILICSGDGSIGWVLSEIDRLNMHKQCQIAVLPLGTGNDLARVLGWGSSCDDDAHLPQLLDRYEKASTKMLDRWSIMVFEKGISFPRRGMSISHSPDAILSQFEDNSMWHLQSIIETDDFQVVIASVRILCETVNDFIARISETHRYDEQLLIKCDILRQKMGMLLDSLKDEENSVHTGDDLLKTMEEIAFRSASERRTPENEPRKRRFSFGKSEKDKINTKERTSRLMKRSEKEAVQCRANSLKRIIHNIIEHVDAKTKGEGSFRKMSLRANVQRFIPTSSSETSPCTSPLSMSCNNFATSSARLTCISPLPDIRRDSVDEIFFNTLSLPVPRQFADESRRNSGVPENILEVEEENYSEKSEASSKTSNLLTVRHTEHNLQFKYDLTTINRIEDERKNREVTYKLNLEQRDNDDLLAFCPIEVYERNFLRNLQKKQKENEEQLVLKELENDSLKVTKPSSSSSSSAFMRVQSKNFETTKVSNSLQLPVLAFSSMERPPTTDSIYSNDNMTIIDTDVPDQSSSDEIIGETSDIISAISNEEYSVASEILDQRLSESFSLNVGEMIQDLNDDRIGHIDSPETSETTDALHGESLMDDISSVLGHDLLGALQDNTITEDTTTLCTIDPPPMLSLQTNRNKNSKNKSFEMVNDKTTQFGFENRVFDLPDIAKPSTDIEQIRLPSLAKFEEGNDIARKSFRLSHRKSASIKKSISKNFFTNNYNDDMETVNITSSNKTTTTIAERPIESDKSTFLNTIKIQIQGSMTDLSVETEYEIPKTPTERIDYKSAILTDVSDNEDKDEKYTEKKRPSVSVDYHPSSPHIKALRGSEYYRRHSSHTPGNLTVPREVDINRRHSNHNPNLLSLNCSPAASRRISCGTLFKNNEGLTFGSARNIFSSRKSFSREKDSKDDDKQKDELKDEPKSKGLPIINPLVRLPSWPNVVQSGSGFISKCLLANADTLCSLACPLMDPDETLLEGFYERCVMNNYFGIGIDAKISLDFHMKREEHPEKCRSRAKNYMWYGVLGSKQWLQKTYKNLEQRVQLECDGQRIPLPSLQGIVILNIPSFMGGTNFWGAGRKEDDIFLAPSFDDRILEVVAVFGSMQMAACRLINLQHHRIAQCQSVQINILGDEGVPIQVDGEAWLQPPGMIRIIHKNRVQMLARNRSLEVSLKSWHEKQRQHSISIAREQTSVTSEYSTAIGDSLFTERETYLLLNFIECVSTLVKWVKFLIISHPSLQPDLYTIASKTADSLEAIHPNGKLLDGPNLRTKLTELVASTRQLYESSCELLRERGHSLIMREDLETKLSVSLANIEMELRKCTMQRSEDGTMKIYLNVLAPNYEENIDSRKKTKPFWMRFRNKEQPPSASRTNRSSSRETVCNWGVNEVIVWLEALQLSEYIDSFIKNDIRGKELLTLARRDLKELGVIKVGHVKRILQAIKDLQSN